MFPASLKTMRSPMRKMCLTLSVIAIAGMTLAGCATHVQSLPLQSATTNAAGNSAAGSGVAIYFGAQPHPPLTRDIGEASHSVRLARSTDGAEASCEKVLAAALDKLRADAREKGANAVINVTTRFHTTVTDSDTTYTCGVSPSAAAIAVKGELVVLQGI